MPANAKDFKAIDVSNDVQRAAANAAGGAQYRNFFARIAQFGSINQSISNGVLEIGNAMCRTNQTRETYVSKYQHGGNIHKAVDVAL